MAGTILTLLGVAVTFAAGVGYAGDTLRGRVQPNRVTWFVSGVTAWIACAGQVVQGVVLGAVLTFAVAVVPTLIVAASLANRDAYWRTTRLDVVCLALAGAAGLVLLTSSGDLAIAMGITARCLGGVPTVVKAWRAARTEQNTVCAAGVFGAVCTLVAAPQWTFRTVGFALYFLVFCSVMTVLVGMGALRNGANRPGFTASASATASSRATSSTGTPPRPAAVTASAVTTPARRWKMLCRNV